MGYYQRILAFALLITLCAAVAVVRASSAHAEGPPPFTLRAPLLTVSSDFQPALEDPGVPAARPQLVAQGSAGGGATPTAPAPPSIFGRRPLTQGSWEVGALFAFSLSGAGGPEIGTVVRAYWFLPRIGYTFWEIPWYPGSFQIFLEPAAAFISHPAKTYILGVNVILRHTFLFWDRFSPYVEAGAGLLNTNLRIRALGETIEFMPQGGIGFHLHIVERWSLNVGFRWHHISNAGLSEQNLGINSYFPYGGFTYFF